LHLRYLNLFIDKKRNPVEFLCVFTGVTCEGMELEFKIRVCASPWIGLLEEKQRDMAILRFAPGFLSRAAPDESLRKETGRGQK